MQQNKKFIRVIAMFMCLALLTTSFNFNYVNAETTEEKYSYTMFASSSEEGAITVNAGNVCINGNMATNGTIVSSGNMNVNGTKTENANERMIYVFDKIDSAYFETSKVEDYSEDYVLEETNININVPTAVDGEVILTGNINITTALKSLEDMYLFGEVKNTNNSVVFSKFGDIVIDSTNVNLNGLIYAPFGSVNITAQNLNLNNVVIIAETISITAPNVNANYSESAAKLVGSTSGLIYIPSNEWQYMPDENENGFPDLFEDGNNWSFLLDSDGEGLPDSIEEFVGTDRFDADTDGDKLNDFYEFYMTYTDPLQYDTDGDGISDGDEDFDEDGLTNIDEFMLGTHPYLEDTDEDDLKDGDEVNVYGTNPLKADTDEDRLNDGDELYLGTDPLNPDTNGNGILDGDEKYFQTFSYDNGEDSVIEDVIISMEATGNLQNTTEIENIMGDDIICSGVVGLVGEPFSIETESQFEKATISFKIDKTKLNDTEFYNLMFLWYDEENYEFVELETLYDEENSMVSVETTHFSEYMLVDQYTWFEAWATELDYNNGNLDLLSNTVLAIDCSGSMDSIDPIVYVTEGLGPGQSKTYKICKRISAAENFIYSMGKEDKVAIVLFTDSANIVAEMTAKETETLKSALQKVTSGGNTSFNAAISTSISAFNSEDIGNDNMINQIILLSDGESSVSGQYLNDAVNKGIKIHTIGLGNDSQDSTLKYIADKTGGRFFKAFTAEELGKIYAEIGFINDFDTTDNDGDGLYDIVERVGIRIQNGEIIYGCNPTTKYTDDDALTDGEEILPTPVYSERTIYYLTDEVKTAKGYHFKTISDPRVGDTDGDGYSDSVEINEYGSNPAKNEVKLYRWDQGFINIEYTGTDDWSNNGSNISYGGSQNWMFDYDDEQWYSWLGKDYIMRKYGCGLISAADILLYLALTDPKYSTLATSLVLENSSGYIDYDSYIRYLYYMEKEYLPVGRKLGVNGIELWGGINLYSSKNSLALSAKWCSSEEKMLGRIRHMLKDDIPVTLAIGPMSDGGVSLLKWRPHNNDPYSFVKDGKDRIDDHYVTVTGLLVNNVKNETILEISSWGRKYYINYDHYVNMVKNESNFFFSNICYIEK